MIDIDPPRPGLGRNLTHGLLDHLGKAIVMGRFDHHPFPTEAALAELHHVSRSVTREAVKMLTAKGLLSARPRQGTMVEPVASWNLFDPDVLRWLLERKFSVTLLRQFSELRVAIEPEAAALAAVIRNPADLALISRGLDAMVDAECGTADPLEADIAFHVAILQASRNPFYAHFREVIRTALRTSIHFTNRIQGHTANIADHRAVRDAIAAGDPEAARKAMRLLIADVLSLIDKANLSEQPLAFSKLTTPE